MRPDRLAPMWLFGGAAAGLAVFLLAASLGPAGWRAWLAAAFLIGSVPTGAIVLIAMLRLIPGSWREGLGPPLAAGPGLLPLAALATLPILLVPQAVYPWVHENAGGFRGAWLTPLFFAVRGVVWFAILAAIAAGLSRRHPGKPIACAGLIVMVAAQLSIADDWLASLDPGFASSGFALYVLSIEIGLALALATAEAAGQSNERVRDVLGGVLLTAAILWAYLGFMQYFIIWSEDLPKPVAWYIRRGGLWSSLAWAGIVLKTIGAVPLVAGPVRKSVFALRLCSLTFALGAAPEVAWLVLPASGVAAGPIHLALFVAALAALGAAGYGLLTSSPAMRRLAA